MTWAPLPIDPLRGPLEEALRSVGRAVITAPTGSGKSTRVPGWCAGLGLRTLVIEPRRLACRALARYCAQQLGEAPGGRVGYLVRHEPVYSARSRVVFATPGMALRLLQESPPGRRLEGWDALVLDEFHERAIDTDLLLGFSRRADFAPPHLVVMSATLQGPRLARWLEAPLLEGQGRTFPVEQRHHERPALPDARDLEERVVAAVEEGLGGEGDLLVFLPGKGEIAACAQALRGLAARRGLEVLPLHGDLKPQDQDRIFAEEGPRRVILTTNVAETSLTVPRVGVVIDAGLVRQTRYHEGRGVLTLVPIAQDAADQRAGRAGRLRPGLCLRLWSPAATLEPVTRPELLREDLTDAALQVAACGLSMGDLQLLDPPPEYALRAAVEALSRLGCVGADGALTAVGAAVARLPLDARQARALEAARAKVARGEAPEALLHDAVDLLAALAPGRPLLEAGPRSEARERWEAPRCDATAQILALRHGDARRDGLHPWVSQEARRVAAQLRGALGLGAAPREEVVDRRALALAWMEADPTCAYARRRRGDAFGGHGAEVELGRESLLPEEAQALVAARVSPWRDPRGAVHHRVSCAILIPVDALVEAGIGEAEVLRARVERGVLWAVVARKLGGRLLEERDEIPQGALASEALWVAVRQGTVCGAQSRQSRARITRWNLYRRLKNLGDAAPPEDAEAWLERRARGLGLESGEDLPLLLPDDLLWPWPAACPPQEQEWLERNYPQELKIHNAVYDVSYQVAQRTVTLELRGGGKATPPSLTWLPSSWSGWRIQLRRASNVTILRA